MIRTIENISIQTINQCLNWFKSIVNKKWSIENLHKLTKKWKVQLSVEINEKWQKKMKKGDGLSSERKKKAEMTKEMRR